MWGGQISLFTLWDCWGKCKFKQNKSFKKALKHKSNYVALQGNKKGFASNRYS